MKIILISAGHSTVSPKDPGAVGNGYQEAQVAVNMRDRCAEKLRALGCEVIEDGSDGENEPLRKAITLARSAAVAIEFHLNAGPEKATGIEVLSKPNKRVLAKKLASAIHDATGLILRGGDGGYKSDSSGQHPRLGFCEVGGLIVELCFISNKSDMDALLKNFDLVAENLAQVLAAEVGVTEKPSPTGLSYTVVSGDTLFSIARKFSVGVANIKKLNNLTSDDLEVGKVLKVN